MTCSSCGGTREDGFLRHQPGCAFYRAQDMLAEHPDLLDLDAEAAYWYPEDD